MFSLLLRGPCASAMVVVFHVGEQWVSGPFGGSLGHVEGEVKLA